jgi:prepilin-type N-terminal cleavage/methylation domain-containing protein
MLVKTTPSTPQPQSFPAPARPRHPTCSPDFGLRTSDFVIRPSTAFTLLELLVVIAIMGILAAIALPTVRGMKPNAKVAATRQLFDAVGRARQLALSQRTTVYMVFLSTNFWTDPSYAYDSWTSRDQTNAAGLLDKQLLSYAYVSLRSVGDQPGVHHPSYLSPWRTLPQGAYIPLEKFAPASSVPALRVVDAGRTILVFGFNYTTAVPFPSETTPPVPGARPYIALPYIAFDGMGQLVREVSGQFGNYQLSPLPGLIPVSEGNVTFARDANTKKALPQQPVVAERPPGNTLENYSLVYIDRLTGRAHVERRKVQ